MKLTVERAINFGFGLALVILLTIGLLANKDTSNLKETNQWVIHTYKVLVELEAISSSILDEQHTVWRYILTGEERYATAYAAATDSLAYSLYVLQNITTDNSNQQQRLDSLHTLVAHTNAIFHQAIELRRENSTSQAQEFIRRSGNDTLINSIRSITTLMKQEEEFLLRTRTDAADASTTTHRITTIFGSLVALLISIIAIVIIKRDIAERRRTELALRQSEHIYRTLASNVPDVTVMLFDNTLHITLAEGMNMKPEEKAFYEEKYVYEFAKSEERLQYYRMALAGISSVSEVQYGDQFYVTNILPLYAENGQVTSGIVVSQNISKYRLIEKELIAAKEAAELANHTKSEFLANMSHEIRTPMNGIIGMAELLFETPMTQEQQEYATVIRASGEALLTIINDILDFSKIESGKMEMEHRPFDLQLCIEDTLSLLGGKVSEKNLDLLYILEPSVPDYIVGDSTRLHQILLNLVGNAIKFTEAGEICITVQMVEQHEKHLTLQFAVRDTGIGIPADKMHRLFQSFSQVDSSTTRKYGGTGLGLTISKRLIEIMNGRIWVESIEGKGSTFFFTISTSLVKEPIPRPLPDNAEGLRGKHVLLVDDNQTNLRILTLQSQKWGMIPHATTSPQEALRLLQERPFELAIIDMQMPEMNGVELARSIRSLPSLSNLPLILLTSDNQSMSSEELHTLFSAYTSKPVRQSQLFNIIISVVTQAPTSSPVHRVPVLNNQLVERFPMTLLLAEDNIINQKLMIGILRKLGYTTDLAENGLEVLESLEKKEYDLIFMDVQMPELDGLETTRRIIAHYDKKHRPVIIAMTANAMEGDREQCIAAGMDDYISKPVMLEDIQNAIIRWGAGRTVRPSAHTYSSTTMIDYTNLKRMRELDEEEQSHLASDIIRLFLDRTPGLIEDLMHFHSDNDMSNLAKTVHLLKGSCGTIGAHTLLAIARDIEHKVKNDNIADIEQLIGQMKQDYTMVERELKNFL